jgi:hypothetical protein
MSSRNQKAALTYIYSDLMLELGRKYKKGLVDEKTFKLKSIEIMEMYVFFNVNHK